MQFVSLLCYQYSCKATLMMMMMIAKAIETCW